MIFDILYLSINIAFPCLFFCEHCHNSHYFLKVLTLLLLSNYWFTVLFAFKLGFLLKEPRKQKLEKPIGMQIHSSLVIRLLKLHFTMSFNSSSQNSFQKYLLSNYYVPPGLALNNLRILYLKTKLNQTKDKHTKQPQPRSLFQVCFLA